MTKLKTLNDLQSECIVPSEPQSYIGGVNDLMIKSRAEAIKWHKKLDFCCNSEGFASEEEIQKWIRHFFNITRGDLR